jgi:alkylhydroperoxidase/carboxymuconolactone decarboxylase family protein YurZ
MVSLDEIRAEVGVRADALEPGQPLDDATAAIIGFAVRASVTTLDFDACDAYVEAALAAGASFAQLHEALVLVSGLGVHSLMEGSRRLAAHARAHGVQELSAPLDEHRSALWARHVGNDRYWTVVEKAAPGFLDALLRFSPEAFEAFFQYCAVPWRSSALTALCKELISLAVDASTTHRYLPGLRLHLANAIKLGASRTALLQTLEIAAGTPAHSGVP